MPSPSLPLHLELLDRYFAGECTPAEVESFRASVASHPEAQALVDALERLGDRDAAGTPAADATAMWERFRTLRGDEGATPLLGTEQRSARGAARGIRGRHWLATHPGTRGRALGVAIATVLLAVFGIWRIARVPSAGEQRYHTAAGERATLTLRDGTRITLAPQTTLRVATNFGATSRTVSLIGEAYFDVPAAASTPFLVRTGTTSTRVLGTAFGVRHDSADRRVHVAVVSGKVMVSTTAGSHPAVTVTAGNVATVSDSTATVTEIRNAPQYTEWQSDKLIFHHAAVAEVLKTLSRWYGYQIRLADSTLAREHLTAAFDCRSSADALNTLKLMLQVDMTVDGDVILLRPRVLSPSSGSRGSGRGTIPSFTEVGR